MTQLLAHFLTPRFFRYFLIFSVVTREMFWKSLNQSCKLGRVSGLGLLKCFGPISRLYI